MTCKNQNYKKKYKKIYTYKINVNSIEREREKRNMGY